jgi:pimeloyl-ACP methyl ester carboxylesterase
VLLILLALLAACGAIVEGRARETAAAGFPAPGRLVQVNGRAMHIHCMGQGSPTIVLDAGQGGWSSDWADIMPSLGGDHRVCAYDRAGYGWSEPAAGERSPLDAAADLQALLDAAAIEAPYVLVSFSHAGLAGRIFAAQHVEQMAGLVLVDPATEFDNEIMSPQLLQQQRAAVGLFNGLGLMARFGLLRLIGTQNMAGSAPFIATETASPDVYYTFVAGAQWWETSVQEFRSSLDDDHLHMVRQLGPIQDIPLVIIASDTLDASGNSDVEALQAARHETLQSLANQSTQGQFVIAQGSSHNVLVDRPDVVRQAVESVAAPHAE